MGKKRAIPRRILLGLALTVVLAYLALSIAAAIPFSNTLFKSPPVPGGMPSLVTSDANSVRQSWIRDDLVRVDALSIVSAAGPKPITLSAWCVSRDSTQGKPTVVFLAGSTGMDPRLVEDKVRVMMQSGFNCVLLDQRGYGSSAGEMLGHGWYERGDFAAVVDTLAIRYGLDRDRIGIWAISVGASNAVAIAASHPEVKALLLYAPWSDPQAMAVHFIWRHYPVPKVLLEFPVWTAIRIGTWRNKGRILDPAEQARAVRCPVLVVRAESDEKTPCELTEKLFRSLPGPKEEMVVSGAHHNDLLDVMGPDLYLAQMQDFFGPLKANQN